MHHVLQLISVGVDEDHTSSGPLLAGGPVKEKCPVRLGENWCPDFRLRGSSVDDRTPGLFGEGVHSAMKSARIWLLTAWRGWKSSWNSASSATHLAILPVALELCRIALNG